MLQPVILRKVPSKWNARFPINQSKPFLKPVDMPFPKKYLPSDKFGVISTIGNTLLELPLYDNTKLYAFSSSPLAASVGMSQTMALLYSMVLKRLGNSNSAPGQFTSVSKIISVKSPRIGFSIGREFKHQAYATIKTTDIGRIVGTNTCIWIGGSASMQEISSDYRINCRFKKYYVKNGKILSYQKIQKDKNFEYFIKIYESGYKPPVDFTPTGKIEILKQDGTSVFLTINSIDENWLLKVTHENEEQNKDNISIGDFFVLETPWIIEDPQLMFEYELNVQPNSKTLGRTSNDGTYETEVQNFNVTNKVYGIWLPPQNDEIYIQPYVDTEAEDYFKNRYNYNSESNSATDMLWTPLYGVNTKIQGNLQEGAKLFNELDPRPNTVGIIMSGGGGKLRQNFCADHLTGEFLKYNDNYYEIVDHPNGETIYILNKSLTADVLFTEQIIDQTSIEIDICQQNFWKISEIYLGDSTRSGLWRGKITSVKVITNSKKEKETQISWHKTYATGDKSPLKYETTQLSSLEQTISNCETLDERFRKHVDLSGATPELAFTKYNGWKIVLYSQNSSLRKTLQPQSTETLPEIFKFENDEITTSFNGDLSSDLTINSFVEVIFEDIYEPATGIVPYGNFATIISGAPASSKELYTNYRLFLQGYYDTGFFKMSQQISEGNKFSLVDWSFGEDQQGQIYGVPRILVTTKQQLEGLSFVEHGASKRQFLFFIDSSLDVLVFRTSFNGWTDKIEQKAVITGSSEWYKSDNIPDENLYMVSEAIFDFTDYLTPITVTSTNKNESTDQHYHKCFWYYVPENNFAYFSTPIGGFGGIKTSTSERFDFISDITNTHPLQLPLEIYSPNIKTSNNSGEKILVNVPVYYKYNRSTVFTSALEEIIDNSKFTSLVNGEYIAASPSIYVDSLRFTKKTSFLNFVNLFNVFSINDSTMYLIYGQDCPNFYPIQSTEDSENVSKPCVFMLCSVDSGESWISPKYEFKQYSSINPDLKNPLTTDELLEKQNPLMVIYDYTYIGSFINLQSQKTHIFGYAFTRDVDEQKDNDVNRLFLGVYIFNIPSVYKDRTSELIAKTNSETFAYYRQPQVKDSEENEEYNKMNFGPKLIGDETLYGNDYGTPYAEKFVKIIGGKDSGAQIQDVVFSTEIIGINYNEYGEIDLYIRDEEINSIIKIESTNGGLDWKVKTYQKIVDGNPKDEKLIYAENANSPHIYRNYLFFFSENSLKCKVLNTESIYSGEDESEQEDNEDLQKLISAYPSIIVENNVEAQKITVNQEETGDITVFFSKNNYITSKISLDGGLTWIYTKNW